MDPASATLAAVHTAFKSKRLIYRAIEDNDADKDWYYTQIRADPSSTVMTDGGVLRPQTKARSDEALLDVQKSLLGVVICLPSATALPTSASSTPIGVLCLDSSEDAGQFRSIHRIASLSITIAAEHQGRGYGSEAINWALDWAFTRANLHSVDLTCLEFNVPGLRLYEKLGFVQDGRYRKCHYHDRRWWDVLLFSMLEEEWEALRGQIRGSAVPIRGVGEKR
ncbi:acyl-CoA N-acyltransferase [Xylariales sp. PMI_506]|nr:acyl-CoA N-acyltransferase [Xylariales sp. PMI_506]